MSGSLSSSPESGAANLLEASPYRLLARGVSRAARALGAAVDERLVEFLVSETPREDLGDFGVNVARFARQVRVSPQKLAELAVEELLKNPLVSSATAAGPFVNFSYNTRLAAKLLIREMRDWGQFQDMYKVDRPLRIVVEHTSANPVHPLHIGHARNASLGDTLARLLKARGHIVQTRFYINDLGRQVAVAAYGFKLLGRLDPPPGVKKDRWVGLVYAITHTVMDIRLLKEKLEKLKEEGRDEEYREALRKLDELVADAATLREQAPEVFDAIAEAMEGRDPERDVSEIMRSYEYRLDEETVRLVRSVVGMCLEGFRETLSRMGIEFDVWDWESSLAWSGLVSKVLEAARSSPYATVHKGALALDFKRLLEDEELRKQLGLPEGYEVPPMILVRSDGTTLYTTRDVAYSIYKFKESGADRVYNVIAAEQRLEQLQVRLALIALGWRREGLNQLHYAYEMVNLPGQKMSGRRGRYITLDELLDRAVSLARSVVEEKSPHLPEEEKRRIAEAVGTAAVRYALVSVSASKPMTFSLEEALSFERNSAPYIMYTYARAANILERASERGITIDWEKIDYSAADENKLRRKLVLKLLLYPYTLVKAVDELKPELLVSYLNGLADAFNEWYASGDSAIGEPDPGKRNFKLAMVHSVKTVTASALEILGIKPIARM
jgi:arginyl-tRNA synthetase